MPAPPRLPSGNVNPQQPDVLTTSILAQPHRFEFRQVMRLLYREHDIHSTMSVTLGSSTVSAWRPYETESVKRQRSDKWHVTVNRPALMGPEATLPFYLQDITCLQLWENHSRSMADFYQCFDSPMLLRDYRCTVKHQLALLLEENKRQNSLCPDIESLLLRLAGLRTLHHLPARHLIRYAGLLTSKSASAAVLKPVLEGYFRMPVVIEPGPLQREPVEADCLSRIHRYLRQNNQLGHSLMIGNHTTLYCSHINIVIFPNSREHWNNIRNDAGLAMAVQEVARTCMGINISVRVYARLGKEMLDSSHIAQSRKITMRLGNYTILGRPENAPETVTIRLT